MICLISLILGGLGMFLLVLAISFVAAKTISMSKNDFERFTDLEDVLVESEEFLDVPEQLSREIFIIKDGENSNYFSESVKNPILKDVMKKTKVWKSSSFFSTLSISWQKLFGKRLINVST